MNYLIISIIQMKSLKTLSSVVIYISPAYKWNYNQCTSTTTAIITGAPIWPILLGTLNFVFWLSFFNTPNVQPYRPWMNAVKEQEHTEISGTGEKSVYPFRIFKSLSNVLRQIPGSVILSEPLWRKSVQSWHKFSDHVVCDGKPWDREFSAPVTFDDRCEWYR